MFLPATPWSGAGTTTFRGSASGSIPPAARSGASRPGGRRLLRGGLPRKGPPGRGHCHRPDQAGPPARPSSGRIGTCTSRPGRTVHGVPCQGQLCKPRIIASFESLIRLDTVPELDSFRLSEPERSHLSGLHHRLPEERFPDAEVGRGGSGRENTGPVGSENGLAEGMRIPGPLSGGIRCRDYPACASFA